MTIEEELRTETKKWLTKIEEERKSIAGDSDFIMNIDAYISDSKHFLGEGDLIRAFEAVVWAWSQLEIGKQQGILKEK